jgi:pilus assembly protein CpaE
LSNQLGWEDRVPNVPQVLIIDEDLDSRVATRKALQRAKLVIAGEVGLGAEALSFADEVRPDVILIAVEEPVTRPLETVESIANVLPQTPVIFYSSLSDPDSLRRAMLAGARDYLIKPVNASKVIQSVDRALELEERRQMRDSGQMAATAVRGTVITVTGAKGGIGKSVIAVNLALALRRAMTRNVVILDADTHFGDVATMLDLKLEDARPNFLPVLNELDRWKVGDYLSPGPAGLNVLAPPADNDELWEDFGPDAVSKSIDLLSLTNDFVVVDTSGSFDAFARAAIEASTLVLLVTTGEVSSVRDTKGAFRRLDRWKVPREKVKVVLNRSARSEGIGVKDLEESLGQSVFWELPRDTAIPRSVQLGEPVVLGSPKSAAARSILALAGAIGGTLPAQVTDGAGIALLSQLKLWRRNS